MSGSAPSRPHPRRRRARAALAAASPLVLLAVGAALARAGWRKWPDLYVDFGRELYVPWRLAEGARLGSDIASFNGPLSAQLNALLFAIFSPSLTTLMIANLVWLGALSWLVHRMLSGWGGRAAALIGGLVLLRVFAFSQFVANGNYNFVCPYAHEATHGVVVSFAALFVLTRPAARARLRDTAIAGLLAGLVFLTKTEVFIALLAASAAALAWRAGDERGPGALPTLLAFAGGLALPAALVAAWQGADVVLAPWRLLISENHLEDPYYRRGLGLDTPLENLSRMLRWTAPFAALIGLGLALGRLTKTGRFAPWIAGGAGFALTMPLSTIAGEELWFGVGRILPLATLAGGAWCAAAARRAAREARARYVGLAVFAIFGFVLLGKMLLFPRVWHYGFVLAMPATLLIVSMLSGVVPSAPSVSRPSAGFLRGVGVGLALLLCAASWQRTHEWFAQKTERVGTGGDVIDCYPGYQGESARFLIEQIERLAVGDETLLVVPEGVMLNYLTRRPSPIAVTSFMPLELSLFGEESIVAALEASPPDLVATLPRDLTEYGRGGFGEPGYGQQIMRWIRANYLSSLPATASRTEWAEFRRVGISVFSRRAAAADTTAAR